MTTRRFDADVILATLKGFQRRTVEHVTERFYGPTPTRRFLVADETGLGKSLVARGVIARAVERLLEDPTVDRIDIVYVCSNAQIAQQNVRRLNVTGERTLPMASRLTLLAKHARVLRNAEREYGKPINLISFTPGTSFEMGWSTGMAEERALLLLLLQDEVDARKRSRRNTLLRLLQFGVTDRDRFESQVNWLENELHGGPEPGIARDFVSMARELGLIDELGDLMEELGGRWTPPEDVKRRMRDLTRRLRTELARTGVRTLEPDLVILDEFQRFRYLLTEGREAADLARHLFDYGEARVLLLSATPFKAFSFAEEAEEDHERDFGQTLSFLAGGGAAIDPADVAHRLRVFRRAAVSGQPTDALVDELRRDLLRVMSRSERSDVASADMFAEHVRPAARLEAEDLLAYVGLRDVAREVKSTVSLDYWKSVPYFLNFSGGYQLGERLRAALGDEEKASGLRPLLDRTQHLARATPDEIESLDYGNARMRALATETVDAGWCELLWVPPSLPYLVPQGPFAKPSVQSMTKRLVFSSWAATPTAVASLLSFGADRQISGTEEAANSVQGERRRFRPRLRYSLDNGRPEAMMTLALFWPMPTLADLGDPLAQARARGRALRPAEALRAVIRQVQPTLPSGPPSRATASAIWYWAAALRWEGSVPAGVDETRILLGQVALGDAPAETDEDADDSTGPEAHVRRALDVRRELDDPPPPPPSLAPTIAQVAMHSPGNIAWRALGRIAADQPGVSAAGRWRAAFALAEGLRTLFNRRDATLLLDHLARNRPRQEPRPYWREVLGYCEGGNLQAVLDEHLSHLYSDEGPLDLDDDGLLDLARKVARTAALRPSRYTAFDPLAPEQPLIFNSRFALRYGGRRENEEDTRQPDLRDAFNSPFWPFVLATTSVGQEGIDFHRWCHAVVHWNTPSNPVDFDQREGRVDRYAGHAIRRNLAHRHAAGILTSTDPNPWRAAFDLGADEQARFGDFAPWWVYPGPAKIERHVMPYPLSSDQARLEQLKEDLALYRLTFGQPRQEDMLELLRRRGVASDTERRDRLRIHLDPPPLPGERAVAAP